MSFWKPVPAMFRLLSRDCMSTWRRIPRVGRLSEGLCKQQIPSRTYNAQFITFQCTWIHCKSGALHCRTVRSCYYFHRYSIMSLTNREKNRSATYLRSSAISFSKSCTLTWTKHFEFFSTWPPLVSCHFGQMISQCPCRVSSSYRCRSSEQRPVRTWLEIWQGPVLLSFLPPPSTSLLVTGKDICPLYTALIAQTLPHSTSFWLHRL